jgi:hypothetical protein
MGYYAHCDDCDGPMPIPSLADAILGETECSDSNCGGIRELDSWERRGILEELENVIEKLETNCECLKK